MRTLTRVCLVIGTVVVAPAPAEQPGEPTFWKGIRPVFQKHCAICHSTKNIAKKDIGGGLALTTFEAAVKDPKQPVVVPGKSAESKLFQLLITTDEDKRMPKDGDRLPPELIELIERWIDSGAKEGDRPAKTVEEAPVNAAVKRPTSLLRSLDVLLPSNATLPADVAKTLNPSPANPGKLDLALKIGPLPSVTALGYSPDGTLLAVGSYGAVALWDLGTAEVSKSFDLPGAVHFVAFSPDGAKFAAAGGLPARSGFVTIFDTTTWLAAATFGEYSDVVYGVAFSPDGQKLATASFDKTVKVWELGNDLKSQISNLKSETSDLKPMQTLKGHSDFVYSVAFTPDGKRLLSSSKDCSVKVYDTASWQAERTLSGHNEDVLTLAVSPDSKTAVSAGKEPQLRWWTIENGQSLRTTPGHSGTVNELVFSRDGKRLASVGHDKTVRIWDGGSGAVVRSIPGATEWLYSVALSPDAKFVAAGSWDGLVRVWETETGRPLATLVAPPSPDAARPQWLAATPEGYYHASDDLTAIAQWRTGGQMVSGDILMSSLRQSESVRKALRGEPLDAAKFPAANP